MYHLTLEVAGDCAWALSPHCPCSLLLQFQHVLWVKTVGRLANIMIHIPFGARITTKTDRLRDLNSSPFIRSKHFIQITLEKILATKLPIQLGEVFNEKPEEESGVVLVQEISSDVQYQQLDIMQANQGNISTTVAPLWPLADRGRRQRIATTIGICAICPLYLRVRRRTRDKSPVFNAGTE